MIKRVLISALLLSQILSIFGFNYLKFDGNLSQVDFSYEKVPLDKELQEEFDFMKRVEKDAIEVACINLIRNSIVSNNLNVTNIMENAIVEKKFLFDKILVNTFSRCVESVNFQEANKILSTDQITFYNSTFNYAIPIYPHEYDFKTVPTFNEKENQILDLFYGEGYVTSEAKKTDIKSKKAAQETGFDLFEFIDSPKNRQTLIGFSTVLIICYLVYTLFFSNGKKVEQATPSFEKPKYYKKKQ